MSDPLPRLPRRDPKGHKGTFGTVAVVGGCCAGEKRMIGAPALAALGAARAGAGLVRLVMPGPVLSAGMVIAPSATGLALEVDAGGAVVPHAAAAAIDGLVASSQALVVGPGLGEGGGTLALTLRAVQQEDAPVVVDADALNALAHTPELWRDFRARAVLTPHPGEFRRLAGSLRIGDDPADPASRPRAAEALAQRLGCVVALKGVGTVVSDGQQTWVCGRGHACMGTGGTGDVLGGVIAGLIAQFGAGPGPGKGMLSLFDCARLGVEAHGIAGERWAASRGVEAGLLAQELADEIPVGLETLRA